MSFFQRLQDVLGLSEQYDQYDYVYDYEEEAEEYPALYPDRPVHPVRTPAAPSSLTSKIIEMPGMIPGQMEVVLMEPRSFEAVSAAIVALRERKSVILNLGMMDSEQAQRSVDYVAGGTFAIDGDQERLGEKVFLFTPSFVKISRTSQTQPKSEPQTHPTPASTSSGSATAVDTKPTEF